MNQDIGHAKKALDKAINGKLTLVQTSSAAKKEPSEKLRRLINECASQFSKLEDTLQRVKEQGLQEGFTPIEIGDMIRGQMINAGYHRSTVARILPTEFKHMEKARSKFGRILLPKAVEDQLKKDIDTTIKEDVEKPTSQYMETNQQIVQTQRQIAKSLKEITDIEQFSMADRHFYKPEFLGKVINELVKIRNQKVGQNKKYQPTPDEIKERENMVLSLVRNGVTRISNLVKQSGIPETPVRRYLLKNGYKVTAGIISK